MAPLYVSDRLSVCHCSAILQAHQYTGQSRVLGNKKICLAVRKAKRGGSKHIKCLLCCSNVFREHFLIKNCVHLFSYIILYSGLCFWDNEPNAGEGQKVGPLLSCWASVGSEIAVCEKCVCMCVWVNRADAEIKVTWDILCHATFCQFQWVTIWIKDRTA